MFARFRKKFCRDDSGRYFFPRPLSTSLTALQRQKSANEESGEELNRNSVVTIVS